MSKLVQVLVIGGLIRFVLPTLLPQIPFKLSSAVEVATPINSFKTLQEAFYYVQNNIDLYDGGVNHHPPVLVVLLNLIDQYLPKNASLVVFNLIYTAIDLGITLKLIQLNKWYNNYQSERINRALKGSATVNKTSLKGFNDDLIASFYLFNPLIIVTNLSHSTLLFPLFLTVEALVQLLVEKNRSRSFISIAVASYCSSSSAYLLVPLMALAHATSQSTNHLEVYKQGAVMFIGSIGALLLISIMLTSDVKFMFNCYFRIFTFDKISPNLGLWWYLFTEMFDFFTPFYIGVFNIYQAIFIIPITLRLFEYTSKSDRKPVGDSFLAFMLCYTWISFTKPYPTLGDLGFTLSILPIFKSTVIPHCKFLLLTGLVLLVCLLLSPIFYYCWIVLGNGNSNFFYSINLIWGAVHALILMDLIWARLCYDYIQTNDLNPEQSAKLRLTQI